MTLDAFALAVASLRRAFAGSITSWGRTPQHNAAVGGVADSQHLNDLAVDIVWDAPVDLAQLTGAAHARGLVVIREGDHDHIMAPRS